MKPKGFMLGIALLALAAMTAFLLFSAYNNLISTALGPSCVNHVLREVWSPKRDLRAVVFDRGAGATTDFSTQISIVPAGSGLPDEPGNLFIADANHDLAPRGPDGGPEVDVIWLNDGG